jgi:TatD DNase family protein
MDDLDNIIIRAKDVGIIVVSGYDKISSLKAIDLANKYSNVYASIGIHPSEVNKFKTDDLEWLINGLQEPKVVAIGEIGFDYYWDDSFKEKQKEYFEKQIEIAVQYNYPVVIHSRNAAEDTYQAIINKGLRGIMHCYAYDREYAIKYIEQGFLLGIGGVLTFKNSALKEIVDEFDLKHLITETDAPYLSPVPFRGKTNEPKNIRYIVDKIAEIKGIEIEEVERIIEDNAKKIFSIRKETK